MIEIVSQTIICTENDAAYLDQLVSWYGQEGAASKIGEAMASMAATARNEEAIVLARDIQQLPPEDKQEVEDLIRERRPPAR